MVTKKQLSKRWDGDILHHITRTNADGTPMRVRVSGMLKTWKRDPERFKLPVKYGLYENGYITPENAGEWVLA